MAANENPSEGASQIQSEGKCPPDRWIVSGILSIVIGLWIGALGIWLFWRYWEGGYAPYDLELMVFGSPLWGALAAIGALLGVRGLSRTNEPEIKWGRRLSSVGLLLIAVSYLVLVGSWWLSWARWYIFG